MVWKDEPDVPNLRFVLPVVTVKPKQVLIVRITCERWVGLDVHWNGHNNIVCQGKDFCSFCRVRLPQWQGFLSVERPADGAQGLLRITSNIVDVLRQKTFLEGSLHQHVIQLSRAGSRKNSPLLAKFLNKEHTDKFWSQEELRAHVRRLFKIPNGDTAKPPAI